MRINLPSRRQLEVHFDGMDLDYDAAVENLQHRYDTGMDLLIEQAEIELTAAEQAAMDDFLYDATDQVRGHRSTRRTGRTLLRSLPAGLVATAGGELGHVEGQAA